jgi:hypothetical protein
MILTNKLGYLPHKINFIFTTNSKLVLLPPAASFRNMPKDWGRRGMIAVQAEWDLNPGEV